MDTMIYRFDLQHGDKALKTLASLPPGPSASTSCPARSSTSLTSSGQKQSFGCFQEKKKALGVKAQFQEDESLQPKQVLKVEGLVCLVVGVQDKNIKHINNQPGI